MEQTPQTPPPADGDLTDDDLNEVTGGVSPVAAPTARDQQAPGANNYIPH